MHAYICTKGGHNYKCTLSSRYSYNYMDTEQANSGSKKMVSTYINVLNNQVNAYA